MKLSGWIKERKERLLLGLLTAGAIPIILLVEAPLEIFAGNMSEFTFSFSQFFAAGCLLALACTLALTIILMALPKTAYRIVSSILLATALLLFLQGNYLNAGIHSLIGDNMGNTTPPKALVVCNLVFWIAVESFAVFAAIRWGKGDLFRWVSIALSVVLIGTQLISGTTVLLTTKDLFLSRKERLKKSDPNYYEQAISNKNLNVISSQNNIFYFCIDRFDERYAETAYEQKPELFDSLDGFTWFQDNIAIYGHTFPAIAEMLTGNRFNCTDGRETYLNQAYVGESPLSELYNAGYTVNLYSDPFHAYTEGYFLPDYIGNLETVPPYSLNLGSQISISGKLSFLGLYRDVPLITKQLFANVNSRYCNQCVTDEINRRLEENGKNYSMRETDVADYLKQNGFQTTANKNFSFIHVDGCHGIQSAAGKITDEKQRKTIVKTVSADMKLVQRYLNAMKEAGVYENATVIITGDHSAAIDNNKAVHEPRQTALFVKPSGSAGTPLVISDKQVSHENIWGTIYRSEGLTSKLDLAPSVFDVPDGDQTRTFIWHTWRNRTRKLDEYIYSINGNGGDFANWKLVQDNHYNKFLLD